MGDLLAGLNQALFVITQPSLILRECNDKGHSRAVFPYLYKMFFPFHLEDY